ncbi:MAG: hypothetical protein J6I49_09620 [Bacteroidales bacterium]|nr:hypothetical protein [Bacteroidales bacterium]
MKHNNWKWAASVALVAVMAMGSVPASAQSDKPEQKTEKKEKKKSKFGSFVRRVGEATTGINMSDELMVNMPMELKMHVKVGEVTAVGDPASGQVLITVTVTTTEDARFNCGSVDLNGDKCLDAKGREYKVNGLWRADAENAQTKKGIPHTYQYVAYGIPTDLTSIELLPLGYGYYAGGFKTTTIDTHEVINIRNIPIEWSAQ